MQLFFEPRSVVLIGTSRQTGPGAYNNLEMLLSYGYPGRIYLVHPKVPDIMGYKTYPRVADLPEVPDLAVISLGRERVVDTAVECAQHGIKRLVVISQGFADADARGAELQAELVRLAREHGVRVLGPNTMGVLNPFSGFTTAFIDVPRDPEPAPLTMVAQSGAFQVGASSFTGRLGKAIDVGNACDLDVVDVLEYLADDPDTRIIVLHLEGIKRGRRFLATAARVARTQAHHRLENRAQPGRGQGRHVPHRLPGGGRRHCRSGPGRRRHHPGAHPGGTAGGVPGLPQLPAHGGAPPGGGHRHRRLRDHRRGRLRRPWPGVGPLSRTPPGAGRRAHPLAQARQPRGPLAPGHGHGLLYRGFQTGRRRPALPTSRWMPSWGWGRASPRPAMPT